MLNATAAATTAARAPNTAPQASSAAVTPRTRAGLFSIVIHPWKRRWDAGASRPGASDGVAGAGVLRGHAQLGQVGADALQQGRVRGIFTVGQQVGERGLGLLVAADGLL